MENKCLRLQDYDGVSLQINGSVQPYYVRILRIQKEEEEAENKKMEAAIQREQELQEFVKEKEKEILQLQV